METGLRLMLPFNKECRMPEYVVHKGFLWGSGQTFVCVSKTPPARHAEAPWKQGATGRAQDHKGEGERIVGNRTPEGKNPRPLRSRVDTCAAAL